jgi:hypothetical protein
MFSSEPEPLGKYVHRNPNFPSYIDISQDGMRRFHDFENYFLLQFPAFVNW